MDQYSRIEKQVSGQSRDPRQTVTFFRQRGLSFHDEESFWQRSGEEKRGREGLRAGERRHGRGPGHGLDDGARDPVPRAARGRRGAGHPRRAHVLRVRDAGHRVRHPADEPGGVAGAGHRPGRRRPDRRVAQRDQGRRRSAHERKDRRCSPRSSSSSSRTTRSTSRPSTALCPSKCCPTPVAWSSAS